MPPTANSLRAAVLDAALDAVLDSWDRNNRILVNLLRAVPANALDARAAPSSKSVLEMFVHMQYVRLIFLAEDAPDHPDPDHAEPRPPREWLRETDPERIAAGLDQSARLVREAVEDRLRTGQPMLLHYDHPLLLLQHMIWHEGYHHGQIKLALKLAGHALDDERIGRLTWGVWMDKTGVSY